MRKYLLSLVAVLLLLPTLGLAAEFRTAEVVAKEETPKNLYIGGENPTIDANVSKDLVVAGGNVVVNGNVENNLVAVGGNLNLNGKVGENVRAAGGTVLIEGEVSGDVVVFGGDVIFGTKSVISGDVIVFGGTLTLKGKVLGSVKSSFAGDVDVSGNVAGDFGFSQVGTLNLDPTAVIGGDINYSSQNEATVATEAKVGGEVKYTKITATQGRGQDVGNRIGSSLFSAFIALIALLVFIKLLPKFSAKVVNTATVNPWAKVGIGFLAMVITPLVLIILLITILGWGIMAYLGLAYAVIFALTGTFTALFAGSLAWKYLRREQELAVNWQTAVVGVLLVAAAKMIPIIGWLAVFAVSLVVFGTLTLLALDYLKAQRV